MRWICLAGAGLLLVSGCTLNQAIDDCPVVLPKNPLGTLLRLDPETGDQLESIVVPYSPDVRATAGGVTLSASGTPSPVAQDDRRRAAPRTTSTPGTLTGPGGWRLRGADGTELGVVGDRVVVLGDDVQLRGVRLSDGRQEWNTYLDLDMMVTDAEVLGSRVYATGIVPRGILADATSDLTVVALDGRTGRVIWSWTQKAARNPMSAPVGLAVFDDVVVTASRAELPEQQPIIVAVDRRTGRKRWQVTAPRPDIPALVRSGKDVIVVTMDVLPGCA